MEKEMTTQVKDKVNDPDIKDIKDIKTITWNDIDTWHCQKCNAYIDDKIEEMEMHECKQMEIE
jgi:hypothetical protein